MRTAPIVCPEESHLVRPQTHTPAPVGIDAPTPARVVGCRPEGGSTFFRSERKYQRKHAARRYLGEGEGQVVRIGMLPRGVAAFARQKAKVIFKSR